MQIPYRKPPKFSEFQQDPLLTQQKFLELQSKLKHLLASRPQAADEVNRLAQNGDFSENAEYQHAKGRLRGMNSAILKLEHQISHAVIIKTRGNGTVEIGTRVTVEVSGAQRTYHILGSAETKPEKGIISYTSPIGSALIGHAVGDVVEALLPVGKITYTILTITAE